MGAQMITRHQPIIDPAHVPIHIRHSIKGARIKSRENIGKPLIEAGCADLLAIMALPGDVAGDAANTGAGAVGIEAGRLLISLDDLCDFDHLRVQVRNILVISNSPKSIRDVLVGVSPSKDANQITSLQVIQHPANVRIAECLLFCRNGEACTLSRNVCPNQERLNAKVWTVGKGVAYKADKLRSSAHIQQRVTTFDDGSMLSLAS